MGLIGRPTEKLQFIGITRETKTKTKTWKQQISSAKNMGSKAKKMMLDFDESDKEGDEDDAQDAELRRFETNFIFRILEFTAVFLFCYHHLSGTETSPPWKETRILWAGGGAGRSSIRRW